MDTFEFFTKDPRKTLEDNIIHTALQIANYLKQKRITIQKHVFLERLPLLFRNRLRNLRKSGQEYKTYSELFLGCVVADILNTISPRFSHFVCFPENNSYDFAIIRHYRGKKPDFQMPQKEFYKRASVKKFEVTEAFQPDDLYKVISNKIDGNKDYGGRILLIAIVFNAKINLSEVFEKLSQIKQLKFKDIWLYCQIKNQADPNKLERCLITNEKFFKLPEINLNWKRIYDMVNEAL